MTVLMSCFTFLIVGSLQSCVSLTITISPLTRLSNVQRWLGVANKTQVYERIVSSSWNLPSILNLVDVLTPFREQNCAVQVDNFFHVNIANLNFPVYLRTPVSDLKNMSVTEIIHHTRLLWVHSNNFLSISEPNHTLNDFTNVSSTNNHRALRFQSQLSLTELESIPFATHSQKVRPWNCQLHVEVFPPIKILQASNFPLPFMMYLSLPREWTDSSSPIPKFTLMIFDPTVQSPLDEETLKKKFLRSEPQKSIRRNTLFLAVNVDQLHRQGFMNLELTPPTAVINYVRVFQVCQFCNNSDSAYLGGVTIKEIKIQELSSIDVIFKLGYSNPSEAIWLKITDLLGHTDTVENALVHLKGCKQES